MSQTIYDPALCAECQDKPVGARRSRYCSQVCADAAARTQRRDAALRFHERAGGHSAFHLKQRYGISLEQYLDAQSWAMEHLPKYRQRSTSYDMNDVNNQIR